MSLVEIKNATKVYKMGEVEVTALKELSININIGEFVSIVGHSGSGKSTLMHVIGCLDTLTSGSCFLDYKDVSHMSGDELARIRNQHIGFVFQQFFLLPSLTAKDNVALPQLYAGVSREIAQSKAQKLLSLVNLSDRANHYPNQLSGGQQQRVAIARCLINDPKLILADEPTGNLDSVSGKRIMELLISLNKDHDSTIILVTHEPEIAALTKRIVELQDGKIISDEIV